MLKGPRCLLSYYACSLKKFSSCIIPYSFCPSACSTGGAHDVPLLRLLMSPPLYTLHILTESLYCCLSLSQYPTLFTAGPTFSFFQAL